MGDRGVSVVIPVSFAFRGLDSVRRLYRILIDEDLQKTQKIVALGRSGSPYDILCRQVALHFGAQVIETPVSASAFSVASLRNLGAQAAKTPFLLFWDLDLLPPSGLISRLLLHLHHTELPFAIVPCLYLAPSATKLLKSKKRDWKNPEYWLDRLQAFDRRTVLYLAPNTSTIFVKKEVFDAVNGFDTAYTGHGYEDFDICCKLAHKYSSWKFPSDMLRDEPSNSPAFSVGFRAYLNRFSLPLLLDNLFTLHQYHPITRNNDYRGRRELNYMHFANRIRPLIQKNVPPPSSIEVVRQMLIERNFSEKKYSFLFCDMPHAQFLPNRTLRRAKRIVRNIFR